MKRRGGRSFIFLVGFLVFANIAFATETDAEILKDLDLFVDLDVLREGAVFDEVPTDETATTVAKPAPASASAAGSSK